MINKNNSFTKCSCYIFFVLLLSLLFLMSNCAELGTSNNNNSTTGVRTITNAFPSAWVSGSNNPGQLSVFGTKGVAAPANVPGFRENSALCSDSYGNIWLFGGRGGEGLYGSFNDLWKFDGTSWTWVSGTKTKNHPGSYGTKKVPSSTAMPGGREKASFVCDQANNLWVFGGSGLNKEGQWGLWNDLWKFDGTSWTWVAGSSKISQAGKYGTKKIACSENTPGGRYGAVCWIDKQGDLWLFGGWGVDKNGKTGALNDLWKFNGTSWTWLGGSQTINNGGNYASKGISSNNYPAARSGVQHCIDKNGHLWLFGGVSENGTRNDFWKFNGCSWTWISGSEHPKQKGNWGIKEIPSASNMPGSRHDGALWCDKQGNIWLFAGWNAGNLNDMWRYDGQFWTWMAGSSTPETGFPPIVQDHYGKKGIASTSNYPCARLSFGYCSDLNGNFWLFGGSSFVKHNIGFLNDLWRINP